MQLSYVWQANLTLLLLFALEYILLIINAVFVGVLQQCL